MTKLNQLLEALNRLSTQYPDDWQGAGAIALEAELPLTTARAWLAVARTQGVVKTHWDGIEWRYRP